ncbi:hypothetical protein GCM10027068_48270 [Prescottella soli]
MRRTEAGPRQSREIVFQTAEDHPGGVSDRADGLPSRLHPAHMRPGANATNRAEYGLRRRNLR